MVLFKTQKRKEVLLVVVVLMEVVVLHVVQLLAPIKATLDGIGLNYFAVPPILDAGFTSVQSLAGSIVLKMLKVSPQEVNLWRIYLLSVARAVQKM